MLEGSILVGLLLSFSVYTATPQRLENDFKVAIAFVVEDNSAYILPYFLGNLDRLTYSKEKTTLWVRVEEDSKESFDLLSEWLDNVKTFYKDINFKTFQGVDKKSSPTEHDDIMLTLRQEALLSAHTQDYILFIEPDLLIYNLDLIDDLIDSSILHRTQIVAPMLHAGVRSEELPEYFNFWEEISNEGDQVSSDLSNSILERKIKGCFPVSLVHSLFMIHIKEPFYEILSFTNSMYKEQYMNQHFSLVGFSKFAHGGNIMVCNNIEYGKIFPPTDWFEDDEESRKNYVKYSIRRLIWESVSILPSQHIKRKHVSRISKDFDMVYIINLKKRPQRRVFMEHIVYELGLNNYKFFDAVDGRHLNESYIAHLEINTMPGYVEPYDNRDYLTRGEIGCFLSHYFIWEEAKEKGYESILILEDDAEPIENMLEQYELVSNEISTLRGNWDLLYLGRSPVDETLLKTRDIKGLAHLVQPGYSYWTVAYALTRRGINKVLSHRPLSKMVPSDIYLNILFDMHDNEQWKEQFAPRDLIALSANPRLIFPALFPGDDNFISDTSYEVPEHDEL